MGHIEIRGNIDLSQFWPNGKSDADTTKIKLKVKESEFLFYTSPSSAQKKTEVFFNAKVKPLVGQSVSVVKYSGKPRQYITLRLEGIDAPELHYKFYDPGTLKKYKSNASFKAYNIEYRQYYSEIATTELAKMLKKYAGQDNLVPCIFRSHNINKPSDLCDCYGRFVGFIYVNIGGKEINVNEWLIEQALVFPAFYDSTLQSEIISITRKYNKVKSKNDTALTSYSKVLHPFNFKVVFRPKGPVNSNNDKGELLLPKLYRRYCYYSILNKSGINGGTFFDYLKSKKEDNLIMISDFNAYLKSKNKSKFSNMLHLTNIFINNVLITDPDLIVFIEKGSKLIDSNKEEILKF